MSRGISSICRGEPRNFANGAAEFGKICCRKLWALVIFTVSAQSLLTATSACHIVAFYPHTSTTFTPPINSTNHNSAMVMHIWQRLEGNGRNEECRTSNTYTLACLLDLALPTIDFCTLLLSNFVQDNLFEHWCVLNCFWEHWKHNLADITVWLATATVVGLGVWDVPTFAHHHVFMKKKVMWKMRGCGCDNG